MDIDLRDRFIKLAKFLKVSLCIWLIGLMVFIFSVPGNEIGNIDVVVVLTGGSDRLNEGFKIFKESKAQWMLISGIGEGVKKSDFKRYFTKYQINPEQVVLGGTASDTVGNAFEAKMFMQLHEMNKLLLLTSKYHLLRSSIVFSLEIPEVDIKHYGMLPNNYSAKPWRNIGLVISEYNKTIAYLILHYNQMFAEAVFKIALKLKYY